MWLLLLKDTSPSEIMYNEYWYASGLNQTMWDSSADITKKAKEFVMIQRVDFAVDIGCNDGIL